MSPLESCPENLPIQGTLVQLACSEWLPRGFSPSILHMALLWILTLYQPQPLQSPAALSTPRASHTAKHTDQFSGDSFSLGSYFHSQAKFANHDLCSSTLGYQAKPSRRYIQSCLCHLVILTILYTFMLLFYVGLFLLCDPHHTLRQAGQTMISLLDRRWGSNYPVARILRWGAGTGASSGLHDSWSSVPSPKWLSHLQESHP